MAECTLCGGEIGPVGESREFRVRGCRVTVDVQFSHCGKCGEEMWSDDQITAAQVAAATRIRIDRGLLHPSDIIRIRRSLDLTQDEFEQLLGAGQKTVVRWERGIVPPSSAMNELIWLIGEDRRNAERLAEKHGVTLARLIAPEISKRVRRSA